MTIAITSSGITLDGPLVAGEKVAVTVSGLSLAAEDKPTLALLARFPDALLASVELAEDADAPGTWTGELDTATKQTALFFATARADERRDAALELVAGRVSLARLTVPMANSALCPKPDGSPFASPVYVPVPGPPGQGGDPYDQPPEMDGEASAGSADEYARGDHRHPTDATRQAVIEDLAAIRSGAAAGATAVQPSALSAYRTAAAQDAIDGAQDEAIAAKYTKPASGIPASDIASGVIPAAQVQADWNETNTSSKAYIQNKPSALAPTAHASTHAATGSDPLDGSMMNVGGSSGAASSSIADAIGDLFQFKADLDSPSFTGTPTAPTPQAGENSTLVSTTEFVQGAVGDRAKSTSLAPAFSASSTYAVGNYVTHEGLLYKCTTAVSTAGAWNSTKWTAVSAMGEMPAPITVDPAMSSSSTNPVQNKVVDATIKLRVPWSRDNYGAGYTALSIGYRRTPPVGSIEADTGVNSVTIGACRALGACSFSQGADNVAVGVYSHVEGQAGYAAGQSSHCEGRGCSAAGLASHAAGRRAICAASGTAASPTTPHNYAFTWQGDTESGGGASLYYSHGDGTFNINPVPASGSTDPATGFWIGETKLSDYVRYSFASPTPSVSGTSATVACEDRAINDFTVATGITSLTITPPAAVTGRARDFFCRVSLTDSSLPTVTLSGGTIDIGSSEVAGMTQGVNLLMFTEIASGHWMASRRSAS